ncbi:ParB N-terminal domain-containing protein [Mesorhizobium sp. KR9-304]|uniref:ParB/RepB/Spo0J family partition protein n=1 Tax=Mesorhizobium sp. KR9-304 TaxID=3156614 RepID=UPI0032B418DB
MSVVRYLSLSDIRRRPDARAIDKAAVASLADSIREIGLRCPINVRLVGDQYELVAGSHRLAAFELLGESEILVTEVVDDDLHAEMAMIDENLCRSELSAVDRARQTARRKAIHEALHPETRHGGDRRPEQVAKLASCSFAAETAIATGQSERAIRRNAERGARVIAEVLDLVRGTHLETGAYLDKLKTLSPNDQVTAARRDLAQRRTARASAPKRGVSTRTQAVPPGSEAAPPATDPHELLIALLDELGVLSAAAVIAQCPPRERAALCTRLSHLIDVFHQIMEGVAP